jgi:hypothetical protein
MDLLGFVDLVFTEFGIHESLQDCLEARSLPHQTLLSTKTEPLKSSAGTALRY